MFFGILIIFLLFLTAALLALWAVSERRLFGEILAAVWGTIIILAVVGKARSLLAADKILEKGD